MLTMLIIIELLAITAMVVSIIRHLIKIMIFTAMLTMIVPLMLFIWSFVF